jgi:hypothetical protein
VSVCVAARQNDGGCQFEGNKQEEFVADTIGPTLLQLRRVRFGTSAKKFVVAAQASGEFGWGKHKTRLIFIERAVG